MKKLNNITLIGMPGSGKSTIGKLLAKKLGFEFIDCDKYIEQQEKTSLQQIINSRGDKDFCKIEEKRILELLPFKKHVLAPGGSIIYSKKLMSSLKNLSFLVFLDVPFEVIEKRLMNRELRGIIGLKSKSIQELYTERVPLYRKYQDITINYSKRLDSEVINEIIQKFEILKNEYQIL